MEILLGLVSLIVFVAAVAAIRKAERQRDQAWPFGVSKRAMRRAGWRSGTTRSGQIGPVDTAGLANIYDQRERRELLERAARDGLLIRDGDKVRLAGDIGGPRDAGDIVRILALHYRRRP